MSLSKGFRVYQKLDPRFSVILETRTKDETLMFESNTVAVLTTAESETLKKYYTKVLDAYGCLGVLNLTTADDPILYLVLVTACIAIGKIGESDIYRITGTTFQSLQGPVVDDERLVELRKLLNGGNFYFSWPIKDAKFSLNVCAQSYFSKQSVDNRFFWNRSLHFYLWRSGVDCSDWLLKVICGGVEMRTIYAAQRQAKACLISRYSCERAGTRFNVRGVNDDGHVANFVETEQLIMIDDEVCSFVQTRGSVPLFWEQPGFQVGSPKVKMPRGHEASAPAFDRHFTLQKLLYGGQVIVDLLGKNEGEHMLNQAFQSHHKASACCKDIPLVLFDYHSDGRNAKNISSVQEIIRKHTNDFGFFFSSATNIKKTQTGTTRTNCFDCLDRTNAMQSIIGLEVLLDQLNCLGLSSKAQMKARFEEFYRQMWSANADHVSRVYAGTAALGKSKATDAARSAGRAIQNNFLDSAKQDAIDMLLLGSAMKSELSYKTMALLDASCMPGCRDIMRSMIANTTDFASSTNIRVSVGTWNVNGGKFFRSVAFKHELITDWLLDLPKITMQTKPDMVYGDIDFTVPVDIFAIGFQEIVDLNASNIVSASTHNQKDWGIYLQKNLSREHKYIQLTSAQLVGVCLYIFVRPRHAPHIKDMSVVPIKTGLGGATGNKGAIGVRFDFYNTSFCFVCSHFAAGQSNIKERNSQYHDILQKINFPLGRKLWHHDYIFWFGDFNYRIDMTHEEVKDFIQMERWSSMQTGDQLNVQRQAGQVFQGFKEGPTNFPPTYKYDLFCEDYDTSEKCRVPAWTDRILWRKNSVLAAGTRDSDNPFGDATEEETNNGGRLLLYNRAELKSSDHRPVMGIFELEVLRCDVSRRNAVFRQVIDRLGPPDGTVQVELVQLSDRSVDEIVDVFSEIGEILVVRFQGSCMLVTFSSGREALEALTLNERIVDGHPIRVSLRTTNWHQLLEEELNLTGNSESLVQSSEDSVRNSLLDDDVTVPAVDFEVTADEEEDCFEDGISQSPMMNRRRSSVPNQVVKIPQTDPVAEDVVHPDKSEFHVTQNSSPSSPRRSSSDGPAVLLVSTDGSSLPPHEDPSDSFPVESVTPQSDEDRGQDEVKTEEVQADVTTCETEVKKNENDVRKGQIEITKVNSDDIGLISVATSISHRQETTERPSRSVPPPPRPAALPARPPPPSRPSVPPSTAKTSSSSVVQSPDVALKSSDLPQTHPSKAVAPVRKQDPPSVPRQPMRPQMGQRHERPPHVKMISHISTPTNVSHTVHATSIEEAQQLIRRLMQGHTTSTSGNTAQTGATSISGENDKTPSPVAAERTGPQAATRRDANPRPKSEFKISTQSEHKSQAVQRNRSIGSGDFRSGRPPVPVAPYSSHPSDNESQPTAGSKVPPPTTKPRSCPPTPAPRRDAKSCLLKDPEVIPRIDSPTAVPVRSRRSVHTTTTTVKETVVVTSTSGSSSQQKMGLRRSATVFEDKTVVKQRGEMLKAAPLVGVATKMPPKRPSPSVPPPNVPTVPSGTPDVSPYQ